jgi:multiple sugar transport system substrate-binding protein
MIVFLTLVIAMPATAQTNLRFSMWVSAEEAPAQEALLEQYAKLNPGITVELFQQPFSGYTEKMLTMAAGGVEPEVMVVSRLWVPQLADAGLIQPIDRWFAQETAAFRNDIMELGSGTYRNQLYGIPIWGGPIITEYNADYYTVTGLAHPIDLAMKGTWDWDTFVQMGRKLTRDTNGDGQPDVFAHAKLNTRAPDWYIKFRTFGVRMINPDGSPYTDVNAMEKVLQFWQELGWRYNIAPVGSQTSGLIAGTEVNYFAYISDVPNHHMRIGDKFKVEIATVPKGPAGAFTIAGGCPVAISRSTPHANEAYQFARWYAVESKHWKIRGVPPTWSDMRREYRSYLAGIVSWPDAVAEAMSEPFDMEPGIGPHFTELTNGWNQALKAVAENSMAPREGATRMIEHTVRLLQ